MYKGYLTLAGKSQDPIRELAWDIGRKMLILVFILNVNGWYNLAIDALRGLYEWAGSSEILYAKLDEITEVVLEKIEIVAKDVSFSLTGDWNLLGPTFLIFIIILVFLAIVLTFVFSIISSSITNSILILIFPIALICFMFEKTKQVFSQWANMFLSNLIVLVLLTLITDLILKGLLGAINVDTKIANYYRTGFHVLFTGASLVLVVLMTKTIAQGLASVSLDSGASSAMGALAAPAGAAAGLAGKAGLGLGKLSAKAGAKGFRRAENGFASKMGGFIKGYCRDLCQ